MSGKNLLLHASIAILAVAASYYGFKTATQTTAGTPMHPVEMHTIFSSWMAQHQKFYFSPAEQTSRLAKFI